MGLLSRLFRQQPDPTKGLELLYRAQLPDGGDLGQWFEMLPQPTRYVLCLYDRDPETGIRRVSWWGRHEEPRMGHGGVAVNPEPRLALPRLIPTPKETHG